MCRCYSVLFSRTLFNGLISRLQSCSSTAMFTTHTYTHGDLKPQLRRNHTDTDGVAVTKTAWLSHIQARRRRGCRLLLQSVVVFPTAQRGTLPMPMENVTQQLFKPVMASIKLVPVQPKHLQRQTFLREEFHPWLPAPKYPWHPPSSQVPVA